MADGFTTGQEPLLVLSASCPRLFAGIWKDGQWLASEVRDTPALDGLYPAIEASLQRASLQLADMSGFLYDEGSGSILGIRISAMTLWTWRALPAYSNVPVWAFRSLEWARQQVRASCQAEGAFRILADYRKQVWLRLESEGEAILPVSADDLRRLPALPAYHVAQRHAWQAAPEQARPLTLDFAQHPDILRLIPIRPVTRPRVHAPRKTDYQRWTPDRHRLARNALPAPSQMRNLGSCEVNRSTP